MVVQLFNPRGFSFVVLDLAWFEPKPTGEDTGGALFRSLGQASNGGVTIPVGSFYSEGKLPCPPAPPSLWYPLGEKKHGGGTTGGGKKILWLRGQIFIRRLRHATRGVEQGGMVINVGIENVSEYQSSRFLCEFERDQAWFWD